MHKHIVPSLKHEIEKFKAWATSYSEETRSGEWECDYAEWSSLSRAFNKLIDDKAPSDLSQNDIDNIIFSIARDNEIEDLIHDFSQKEEMFESLLPHVIESREPDAKWQFAVILGCNNAFSHIAEEALLHLVSDTDEYTSRMALQSLGKIKSSQTEHYCIKAWNSDHEYQRIMALWVLFEIGSSYLSEYIELALLDDRKYLVQNATELKNARQKPTSSN